VHPCGLGFARVGCFSLDSDLLVCASISFLTDFNDSVASVQAGFDPLPRALESVAECRSTTVAEADPDDFDFGMALLGEVKEVFIFAYDDAVLEVRRGGKWRCLRRHPSPPQGRAGNRVRDRVGVWRVRPATGYQR
jgi:hypothetical protein